MRPTIFGLRPSAFVRMYGWRLRRHPAQELFAGAGIAVGVALVFAVQVANGSITGSATQIVEEITGQAQLQLVARSEDGFDERLVNRVEGVPGVRYLAPLLRSRVAVAGPDGRRSLELLGTTPDLTLLGGELTRNFGMRGLRLGDGVALPAGVAADIGVSSRESITLISNGARRRVVVGAVLGGDIIGPLAGSQAVFSSLGVAQELTGQPRTVSHVLVETHPSAVAAVERRLERIADDRLSVAPGDAELGLVREAAEPNDRSTGLFAAISAMVGFLFALNAMLITSGERRRFVADLRIQGYSPRQVVAIVVFEALVLGLGASLAGLALGDLLSRLVFDQVPDYLAFAFPVGTQRVVDVASVAVAVGGGLLVTVLASLRPVFDLRRGLALDAVFREGGEPGEAVGRGTATVLLITGGALVAATTLVAAAWPGATVVGGVTLALAALLTIPALFSAAVRGVDRLTRGSRRLNMLGLAALELRGTGTRSIALAAVAAVAVYGSVAVGGARTDLVRGLDDHTVEWLSNADVWVTTGGQNLMTDDFRVPVSMDRIGGAAGVAAVRSHHGGLLDVGTRRIWVIGRPHADRMMIPAGQLPGEDRTWATDRLRDGGWATVSRALADERDLAVGDPFTLPTPSGDRTFRVAAITLNMGWGPGAVTLGASDYRRAWRTTAPTALEVDLEPGVPPAAGRRAVERALGPASGLSVQTRAERQAQYFAFGRQGLSRLNQISLLLLIAAALAVACALVATIWQRRPRLAALKIQGLDHWQLWRSLLFETGFVIGVGCAVGSVLGVYGHLLAGRYLELTTGFAAPFSVGFAQVFAAAAMVAGIALVVSAIPGYAATQVPMRASFQE